MDILVQSHQLAEIIFELCELDLVGLHDFFLLSDLLIKISQFFVIVGDPLVDLLGHADLVEDLLLEDWLLILPRRNGQLESLVFGKQIGHASIVIA